MGKSYTSNNDRKICSKIYLLKKWFFFFYFAKNSYLCQVYELYTEYNLFS
nr:MAG TPA: hypothetical protein [Caudoviricetes sp.]